VRVATEYSLELASQRYQNLYAELTNTRASGTGSGASGC